MVRACLSLLFVGRRRPRRLSGLSMLALVVVLSAQAVSAVRPAPARAVTVASVPEEYIQDAVARLNRERAAAGLAELTLDPLVEQVAADRVLDMAWRGYFAHYGPDGQSAFSALADRDVSYQIVGENLARTTYAPDELVAVVHTALMDSPGHRANMLEPRFNRVGVAIAAVDGVYYFAYVFLD